MQAMRLNSYARVSRTDTGERLGQQHADTRAWAEAHGHSIIATYEDDGVSGATDAEERDGLALATEFSLPSFAPVTPDADLLPGRRGVRRGQGDPYAEGLVVRDLDRLSRDVIVQEMVLRDCWRQGKRVFTVTDGEVNPDDPRNPNRKLVRVIMGAVAEFEREMTVKRLQSGVRAKRHRDGWAGGTVPYGWRTVNKQLVPHGQEQLTIERARSLYDGDPKRTLVQVGTILMREDMTPRKRDTHWQAAQIRRMVNATGEPGQRRLVP